jgi:hypothetical protein
MSRGYSIVGEESIDKYHPGKRSRVRKISIVVSVLIIVVMVIAGWALINQSKSQD